MQTSFNKVNSKAQSSTFSRGRQHNRLHGLHKGYNRNQLTKRSEVFSDKQIHRHVKDPPLVPRSAAAGDYPQSPSTRVVSFVEAFWKFLRPHTIRGTLLATTVITTKALLENPHLIDWNLLPKALMGLLALLCGNGYIVGINQIYDEELDKVNKPFLPVAAGELKPAQAWFLVVLLAAVGWTLVFFNFDRLITYLYSFGLLLGTVYSTPPFHLKRFAIPALMIISTVRGFLLNFGVYYATKNAVGAPMKMSPAINFITCFAVIFAVVIAITKDLADVEGDQKFKIKTLAARVGVRAVAFAGSGLLIANYIGAIIIAIKWSTYFNPKVMIIAHALFAVFAVYNTVQLDSQRYTKLAVMKFYRGIWNLFYLEYLTFAFV